MWEWVAETIQTIIFFIRQWLVLMDWVIDVTVAHKRKRGRGQTKQEINPWIQDDWQFPKRQLTGRQAKEVSTTNNNK